MNRVRKPLAQDRRRKPRRKGLTDDEFRMLIQTKFPERRNPLDRRANPRRKADRGNESFKGQSS